ncbi:unnamed protein product, partial [Amoebophrya sp. A25]
EEQIKKDSRKTQDQEYVRQMKEGDTFLAERLEKMKFQSNTPVREHVKEQIKNATNRAKVDRTIKNDTVMQATYALKLEASTWKEEICKEDGTWQLRVSKLLKSYKKIPAAELPDIMTTLTNDSRKENFISLPNLQRGIITVLEDFCEAK